jgi:hypothetical protein
MKGLVIGRTVHFVWEDGKFSPAVVTRVWNEEGTVNLDVAHDTGFSVIHTLKTSVRYNEQSEPLTWHWIPKEE